MPKPLFLTLCALTPVLQEYDAAVIRLREKAAAVGEEIASSLTPLQKEKVASSALPAGCVYGLVTTLIIRVSG